MKQPAPEFSTPTGCNGSLLPTLDEDELEGGATDERLDEDTTGVDELDEETLLTGGQLLPPLTPKGAGWLVQVAREIQLLLFS